MGELVSRALTLPLVGLSLLPLAAGCAGGWNPLAWRSAPAVPTAAAPASPQLAAHAGALTVAGRSSDPAAAAVEHLPGRPAEPLPASRPVSWPGSSPEAEAVSFASDTQPPPASGSAGPQGAHGPAAGPEGAQRYDGVAILATIGPEAILTSDVMPFVNDVLNAHRDRIPPDQLAAQRDLLVKQRLKQLIETKAIVADARRRIPEEGMKNVEQSLGEFFDKRELPKLFEKTDTQTLAQLEARLHELGTSLEREKRAFVERTLASEWVQKQVKEPSEKEITHEEMLAWYREHEADYSFPAKVRWQQLSVRKGTRAPGEAYQELARLGNQIVDGAPFADVARQHSQGPRREEGGVHDWTTRGSLVSKPLDKALFELPVGQMSPIIEDEQAFHIVVVLQRQEAGRTPFTEVQGQIKAQIKKQRMGAAVRAYLEEVKTKTRVWTVFDPPPGAPAGAGRLPAQSVAERAD